MIIDPDSGCLNFAGYLNTNGYGVVTLGSSRNGQRRFLVHRLMYEWFVGPIPAGLQMDHLCRNRGCGSPAHLEAVTQRENGLRGVGACARNAVKTHCVRGHEFTPENTHIRTNGSRFCRECDRARRMNSRDVVSS